MAIDPSIAYPSNTDPPEPDYPWGKARNVLSPGDYTGTPWEAALANDIFGFQQALLDQAGILPTGLSDTARASQYLQGIGKLHKRTLINFSALRAYDAVLNGQAVFVAGAVTAGDGAQGSFHYVSGMAPGTYVDDNDRVILLTGSDGSDAFLRIDDTPYYTDSGSANNYILTRADGLSAYADDMTVVFKPLSDNTGASVVNINSVGAVDLVASDGSALIGGEIKTDQYVVCRYRTATGKFEIVISDGGLMHLAGAETVSGDKLITGATRINMPQTTSAITVNEVSDYLGRLTLGCSNPSSNGDRIPIVATFAAGTTLSVSAALEFGREATGWNTYIAFRTNSITSGPEGTDAIQETMRLSSAGNLQFSGTLTVGGASGTINGNDIYHTGNDSTLMHLAGAETVTGTKTFDAGPTLSNNIALLAKQLAGTVRPIIAIDTSDICYVGNNNIATAIRSNGTLTHNGNAILTAADIVESTFTPVIEGGTTAGTGTYTAQTGYYQKIGNWVHFRIRIAWTAHTGTGSMRVANLPLTSNADGTATVPVLMESITFSGSYVDGLIPAAATYIGLYGINSGAGVSAVAISNGGSVHITGSYQV